jgi:hypothetical protein
LGDFWNLQLAIPASYVGKSHKYPDLKCGHSVVNEKKSGLQAQIRIFFASNPESGLNNKQILKLSLNTNTFTFYVISKSKMQGSKQFFMEGSFVMFT